MSFEFFSLQNCMFISLAHFSTGLVVFFLLAVINAYIISDQNPFSITYAADSLLHGECLVDVRRKEELKRERKSEMGQAPDLGKGWPGAKQEQVLGFSGTIQL